MNQIHVPSKTLKSILTVQLGTPIKALREVMLGLQYIRLPETWEKHKTGLYVKSKIYPPYSVCI